MVGCGRLRLFYLLVSDAIPSVHRPTAEQANSSAPSHARLFKEVGIHTCIARMMEAEPLVQMILVASPSKRFAYSVKGAPRRRAVLSQYEDEIEAVYAAAAEPTQAE